MQQALLEKYEDQVWDMVGLIPGTEGLRMNALKRATDLGLPTTRTEDWQYSDIRYLRDTAFKNTSAAGVSSAPAGLCESPAARIVFINGHYSEDLSDLGDLAQAVQIRPLANHLMSNMGRVDELVTGEDSIALLNTALMRSGMVLSIPAGIVIDDPVEFIHYSTGAADASAHVRHMVEVGEGAEATIFERFIGDDNTASYWNNSLLQARVSENGRLVHYRLQEEAEGAYHTAKAYVSLDAGARYNCVNVSLGGKVARFEGHVKILGEGADATIDGVALAGTGQSHDMVTSVRHAVPGATSDQVVRTVADARGKTAYQGKVIVDVDAQKTEADQSFKALLLDRAGEANAKPELEILADDVKCSHGATVGELDEKAIFYLLSRGVDPVAARQILVAAFAADALERVEDADLKDKFSAKVESWMAERKIGQ
jgi:Fe-S cluster assembly protein SufD